MANKPNYIHPITSTKFPNKISKQYFQTQFPKKTAKQNFHMEFPNGISKQNQHMRLCLEKLFQLTKSKYHEDLLHRLDTRYDFKYYQK